MTPYDFHDNQLKSTSKGIGARYKMDDNDFSRDDFDDDDDVDIGIGEDDDRGAGILFDDEDLFGEKVGATAVGKNKKKALENDNLMLLDELGTVEDR